ncbi:alpha/beta fold hydrolase [Streptomyces sp. NPDC090493]|uniref:alpha/beta fold hydrolase n=1 Tax=Streptomyces sp. NPDC090493 TaxID=3365964 RepID=UPI0038271030
MTELEPGFTPSGVQYLTAGDVGDGLLVFTHGWRDSAQGWQWVIRELASSGVAEGWRFVSVQRQEVSREDEDSAGLLEDFADQVVDVIRHFAGPEQRVVIVGQSMSGAVAELAAVRLGRPVDALVLVNPAPLGGTPLPDEVLDTFKAAGQVLDRVDAGLGRLALAVNRDDTATLRSILSTPAETEKAILQSLASWTGGHPAGNQPSEVTAPVLIVVTDDAFFSEEMLRAAVAPRFGSSHVDEVRGTGHHPHLERPEELSHVISEFLSSLG